MQIVNIVGFEGLYAVTDDGRVFSLKTGKEIVQSTSKQGYKYVSLSKENKHTTVYIHKAVFYSFHSYQRLTRTDDLVIDHIDGNKENNNLSNLRKITTRENTSRAKTNKFAKGVHYYKHINKYSSEITIESERYYLGTFATPDEAADAYKTALRAYNENGEKPFKKDRTIKYCKQCGQTKPISDFYYVKGHGYQTLCKECQRAQTKLYREKQKPKGNP